MLECDYCGVPFDPTATRWLCPTCHMKANCCDGAPLPLADGGGRVCDIAGDGRALRSTAARFN